MSLALRRNVEDKSRHVWSRCVIRPVPPRCWPFTTSTFALRLALLRSWGCDRVFDWCRCVALLSDAGARERSVVGSAVDGYWRAFRARPNKEDSNSAHPLMRRLYSPVPPCKPSVSSVLGDEGPSNPVLPIGDSESKLLCSHFQYAPSRHNYIGVDWRDFCWCFESWCFGWAKTDAVTVGRRLGAHGADARYEDLAGYNHSWCYHLSRFSWCWNEPWLKLVVKEYMELSRWWGA